VPHGGDLWRQSVRQFGLPLRACEREREKERKRKERYEEEAHACSILPPVAPSTLAQLVDTWRRMAGPPVMP
jgi:hypothetical protein